MQQIEERQSRVARLRGRQGRQPATRVSRDAPTRFERFLSAEAARQYMPSHLSARRALLEATCSPERLARLLGDDMKHFHALRAAMRLALTREVGQQGAVALQWKTFLRPRIEMLDYWSSATRAFAAVFAGVLAVGVAAMKPLSLDHWYLLAPGIASAVLALLKLRLDRHKFWYRYLMSHLEVIEMMSPRPGPRLDEGAGETMTRGG